MQRSKHRSTDAELPESSLGLDLLEQITRPSERTLDTALEFDIADEATDEVIEDRAQRTEDGPPQTSRRLGAMTSTVGLADPVTGLTNLPLLIDRLDKALTRRRGADGAVLAIHIELNNLGYVREQLGESVAITILKEIAHRLLSHLRSEDTVASVAASELIVGVSVHDETAMAFLTERLRASLKAPIVLPDRAVHMWTSFTMVEAEQSESAVDLLKRLDKAIRLQSPATSSTWSRSLREG
jgi:diguanylate cyclase (GGDEF)-like protein